MISGYDIRENSLTQNSVFLLLLKADEEGCKLILKELSAFCKLLEVKVKDFDYVFELSGITDDTMLEKLRGKIDFLASPVQEVAENFGNPNETATITVANNGNMLPKIEKNTVVFDKEELGQINLDDKIISLPGLDSPGEDIPSLKIAASETFPSLKIAKGEATIKENSILKTQKREIFQGIDNLSGKKEDIVEEEGIKMPRLPKQEVVSQVETKKEMPAAEKKEEPVVKEDNNVVIDIKEEIKDISVSTEDKKEKRSFWGKFFGKFKASVKSKTKEDSIQQEKKEENDKKSDKKENIFLKQAQNIKEKISSSNIVKQAKEIKQEIEKEIKKEEEPVKEKNIPNPFQNLGSGIIVKKGLLDPEPIDDIVQKEKDDLRSNPLEARLQVDDIFDAQTVCDFYASPQEEKNIDFDDVFNSKNENPAGKAESVEKKESFVDLNLQEKEDSFKTVRQEKKESSEIKTDSIIIAKPGLFSQEDLKKQEDNEVLKQEKEQQKEIEPKKEEQQQKEIQPETEEIPPLLVGDNKKQEKTEASASPSNKKEEEQKIKEEVAEKKVTVSPPLENKKKSSQETIKETKPLNQNVVKKEINKEESKTKESKKEEIKKEETGIKIEKEVNKEGMSKETKKEQISENRRTNKEEKEVMQENNQEELKSKQEKPSEVSKTTAKPNPLKRTTAVVRGNIDHTLHISSSSGSIKNRNYPIEMPLIPTYTFANMDISPIRFAHAMGMATLDSLGIANNPLLLQGVSGTGKTHFLSAMGYEISKKIPQDKILFTNGVRFSRGIQSFLERGEQEKLDTFFNNAQVLIIDDIHLTAVNEHNREYISKVLNDFLKNKKQILLSSKYPPESLKRFEELVNFKFSLGTISELKVPNQTHFARLTKKILTGASLNLSEKEQEEYFVNRNNSLGDVARDVKRVKVLNRRIESSGLKKLTYEEILKEMTGIKGENQNSEIVKKNFGDITSLSKNPEANWGNFGFFFPTSQIDKFRWVAFASQETAKEIGINGGFNYALKSAYSTEHIISAAFKIANICDLKGLKGAVILGPSLEDCKEPIRENFYDILTHMLEVMMIRCGTINFEDIKKPSAYVKMLGDILK